MEWQSDFPPEVQAKRESVLAAQMRAMQERTGEAVGEAQEMALAWLERYPRDHVLLEAGEPVAMLADAIAIMEKEGIAPLEPVDIAAEMERWEAEWKQQEHGMEAAGTRGAHCCRCRLIVRLIPRLRLLRVLLSNQAAA